MTAKEFIKDYYTHDAILKKVELDKNHCSIKFKIEYCEWQLEELAENKNRHKGYEIIFKDVDNISNQEIFKIHNEFISVLRLTKDKVYLGLDLDEYVDLEFSYKNFEVKDF